MGSKEFLTPLTRRWARYLLLSRKRLRVCWGDSLKFLDMEIIKNSRILFESRNVFLGISVMSTWRGFSSWTTPSSLLFWKRASRTLRRGAGYKLSNLLFSAYSRVIPIFLSTSVKMFQLYNRMAGVEFYFMALSFSKEFWSFCNLANYFIMAPTSTPSNMRMEMSSGISILFSGSLRPSLTTPRFCSQRNTPVSTYSPIN